jgi:hypothetical protein
MPITASKSETAAKMESSSAASGPTLKIDVLAPA